MVHRGGARLLAIAAAVLLLGACGGGDGASDGTAPDPTSTTTDASSAATTTTTAAESDFVPPELANTSWNVVLYQLPVGGMTNLWPDTEITVSFSDDGSFFGFSGCNTYDGTYTVEGPYYEEKDPFDEHLRGQQLVLGPMSWTEIACTEPRLVMEQEAEYLEAIASAANWYITDDGNLILQAADGLFRLEGEPTT